MAVFAAMAMITQSHVHNVRQNDKGRSYHQHSMLILVAPDIFLPVYKATEEQGIKRIKFAMIALKTNKQSNKTQYHSDQ